MQLKLHRYVVIGRGPFPEDMLRYDSCWPSRQSDVPLPRHHIEGPGMAGTNLHRVEIVGIKPPTTARWNSFGWAVDGRVTVIK
jgi:hypothetical protein